MFVLTEENSLNFVDNRIFTSRKNALLAAIEIAGELGLTIAVRSFSHSGQIEPAPDIVQG